MTTALQAKLLRALESGEVRRIGENESRRVDVRFVAATNVDLKAAVDSGAFRSDLYYRLNVHRVHMPPLRERGGDVPLLVEHFLERYGRSAGITGVAAPAMAALEAYSLSRATCGSSSTSSSARSRSRSRQSWSSAICPRSSSYRNGRIHRHRKGRSRPRESAPSAR